MVSQALLEKAIAIDPSYGQALGVLAASHTFGAHMGWEDMASAAPLAESAALKAMDADNEDPWAHYALGCVYLFKRRFDNSLAELEFVAAAQSELLVGAGVLRFDPVILRTIGGGERGCASSATAKPA